MTNVARCKMNDKLNTRDFLHIFDVVMSHGQLRSGVRELSGIQAWHDHDGYVCWLSFEDLTVTLLFHGKLSIEYEKEETLAAFQQHYKNLTVKAV